MRLYSGFVKKWWLLIGVLVPLTVFGQENMKKPEIYQFSGLIVSASTGDSIPYATVRVKTTRQGILSNVSGFFSIPVSENDTLVFDHVGFYPYELIIKDYLEDYPQKNTQYIYSIIYMLEDTVTLPTVNIFPYDTPEELKTAVVNMEIPDDSPEAIASRNMDPRLMYSIISSLPMDSGERIMVNRQMYYDYYRQQNIVPTIGLDPIAATRLLQYAVDKAQKKKNKGLNYWEE